MSIELKPFCHEAKIALSEEFTLHMVLDFSAVDRLERLLGTSIDKVVGSMLSSVSNITKVLWGVTREHHPDLSLNQIAGILLPGADGDKDKAEAVVAMLGHLFKQAFNVDKPKKKRRG